MRYTSRVRREYLDNLEYVDKLSEKEKEWLNNFNEEYLSANFNHPGKKLHKTKAKRREIYGMNNAKNRDALAIAKASNSVRYGNKDIADLVDQEAPSNPEDAIIEMMDMDAEVIDFWLNADLKDLKELQRADNSDDTSKNRRNS